MQGLTPDERESWERDGFLILRGFADSAVLAAMEKRIVELVRTADAGESIGSAYVVPELALADREPPEARTSKVFRVHRDEPVFREFAEQPALLDRVESLLGPELDCFLSQFIFKRPGALGQPWHQDAFYFPFDRGPQIGAWLAVTDATLDNGPLWVLPGSHREPVHDVVGDRREHANFAYVEIVDHDMEQAIPVLMTAGDLLLFHSHLMHRSTDNESETGRAAMVYHYGEAGTVDGSRAKFGIDPPNIDWMPVRRGAR
ncbi:MAG: phytanoyl-CoA dioxygenase family protein [Myxococcales bacterium]|nr:phytanoyl-CoA dioxygenase family protein [Myxococcales bacterium]